MPCDPAAARALRRAVLNIPHLLLSLAHPAPQLRSQYTAQIIICSICLAVLLGCLLMTLSGMARVKRAGQQL